MLADGVAGPEAHFAISGQFEQAGRALTVRLDATPKDSGEDHIRIDAQRTATGDLHLDADIAGAPGGTLATLMKLPDDAGLVFTASASGDLRNAAGEAQLDIGGAPAGSAKLSIVDSRLTAVSDIRTAQLVFLGASIRSLVGESASLQLESTTRGHEAPFGLEARFTNGSASVRGLADTKAGRLKGPADLDVRLSDTSALLRHQSSIAFKGTAAKEKDHWALAGHATLTGDGSATLPFSQLSGPVSAEAQDDAVPFEVSLTAADPFPRAPAIAGIFGTSAPVSVTGRYVRKESRIDIETALAGLADGTASAKGSIDLRGQSLDLQGAVESALNRLPGGYGGRISGPVSLKGEFRNLTVDANFSSRGLSGLPDTALELVGASPSVRATLGVTPDRIRVESARIAGAKATASAAGDYALSGSSDLRVSVIQTAPVTIGDWSLNLVSAQVQFAGKRGAWRIILASRNGKASGNGREISDLSLDAALSETSDGLAGPVDIKASSMGEALTLSGLLSRQDGETRFDAIEGAFGPGTMSGDALLRDDGAMQGDFSFDGSSLALSGLEAAKASGTVRLERPAGAALALQADVTAETVRLANATAPLLDKVIAKVTSAPEGYDIAAQFLSDDPQRPTDLTLNATASFGGEAPSGLFRISGMALGEAVSTSSPAKWRLGSAPELAVELALLKGTATANLVGAGDATRLVFDLKTIDLSPVLAAFGDATSASELNGHGDLSVFGAEPGGTFQLVATSDVPGLDTSLEISTQGTLMRDAAVLRIESGYGGKLALNGEARVPVIARAGHIVQPDRASALSGEATLTGDLSVLRTIALAFGHDAGGSIDARATLAGTLAEPRVTADAAIDDGIYEFGATGFRVTGVSLASHFENRVLTVSGSGKGTGGGRVDLDGKLAGDDTDLTATLKEILIYNRDGDYIRATGNVVLADNPDARTLTGDLFFDQARLSIDNLPSSRPRALDVRWEGDPPASPEASRLRRTLGLNVRLKADRRIMINGRGLDSEWRLDMRATGTPADLSLNGKADLVRGNLDLAGRPFVFDTGRIDFDGPPSRARIAVSAERSVNGFNARVDVSGSPTKPMFELSSTPDLPQDEILSRLLFGRSSMDLSPLEAAQLASSIANFSGRSSGFDPVSGVGAALGLDHFSLGTSETGAAQVGVGQYLSDDVYLQLKSAGAEGSSVEVEWQPKPLVSITSETHTNGESKVSVRWKRDY
ncbi:MAG: translocation/assembly module TamB domain-containing protein [Hyphomonas sp.]